MKVKINNKNHEIKTASELTVKEYIQFFDIVNENSGNIEKLAAYISVLTGENYFNVQNIKFDSHSLRRLSSYIGEIQQPEKMRIIDNFYYKKTGKRIFQKLVNWRALGVRSLLELRKTDNSLELAVYLLAIIISGDFDSEKIEEIYNELQEYNAISVFGFAIFFLLRLSNGKKSDPNYLNLLLIKVSINIQKLLNKFQVIA